MEHVRQFVKGYWLFLLLFGLFLAFGSTAALLFEFSDRVVFEFIIASFIQAAGVFLALALAYLFFEQRSHKRQKSIDEAVRRSAAELRGYATTAVITTVGETYQKAQITDSGPSTKESVYKEARKLALEPPKLPLLGEAKDPLYSGRGYLNFLWIFRQLERLADNCETMVRLLGPALMEYDVLVRSMTRVSTNTRGEGHIWKEFEERRPLREEAFASWEATQSVSPGRLERPLTPAELPPEAIFNLLALSKLAVRLVDVLDSPGFAGDREYEGRRRFAPEVFLRSAAWGEWSRRQG